MPSEDLKFELTDLYASAPTFSRVGSQLADAVSAAKGRLEGLGAFWGNDAPGQKFGSVYAPDQERLLHLLGLVAAGVKGVSDGITAMADRYGIAEQDNQAKVKAIQQEMP